jgi:predicted nucleic acid-binding protein
MIVIDNTLLSLLLHPKARPPQDPTTGSPVDRLEDRLELLLQDWEEDNETILIPTPVLSEFLILADKDGPAYLSDIDANPHFIVAAFDQKAAVELAVMNLAVLSKSKPKNRRGDAEGTWAKIVFDRQIVAIAKSNGASVIYSDDNGLEKFAKQQLISVVKTWEIPLPPAKQIDLPGVEPKPKARKIAFEDEDV